jgi:hypothetical protein
LTLGAAQQVNEFLEQPVLPFLPGNHLPQQRDGYGARAAMGAGISGGGLCGNVNAEHGREVMRIMSHR